MLEFTWWQYFCVGWSVMALVMCFLYAYRWGKCVGMIEALLQMQKLQELNNDYVNTILDLKKEDKK